MFRALSLVSLASLFALTVGCSGSPDAQGEDTTDDALTASNTGYFVGFGPGLTGGISVHLANAKTTKCADGSRKGVCGIFSIDYSQLHLGAGDEKALDEAFQAGHAVIKGRLAMSNDGPHKTLPATFPLLIAEQAWKGVASKPQSDDLDQLVRVNFAIQNELCSTVDGNCQKFNQVSVNVTRSASIQINDVSLDGLGGKQDQLDAQEEMKIGAEGLLVLGHDVALVSNHDAHTTRTLLATDFYLPVAASVDGPRDCRFITCAQGMHCEMKGINGGSVPACVNN
jgi:Domain of unknown function (DUF6748)